MVFNTLKHSDGGDTEVKCMRGASLKGAKSSGEVPSKAATLKRVAAGRLVNLWSVRERTHRRINLLKT